MRWSYRLGTFAGIPVYLHATFLLILLWVVAVHGLRGEGLSAAAAGVGFVLALFACVLLHEFGHALAARRYGIKTKDITLLPIGGLARLERMPTEPRQELVVALAGPAVNVVLAAGLFLFVAATGTWVPLDTLGVADGSLLERLMLVNVWLVAFNLIPAFPMDGGRVLRALLATRMPYVRATQAAATLGQGIALVFGFIGLFTNPFLLFIALFVWIGASAESGMVQVKSALSGIPVRSAMLTEFHTLTPGDPLGRVVDMVLAGSQQDFPVLEGNEVVGILTRADLIAALASTGPQSPVGRAMRREFPTAQSTEMLEDALPRLHEGDTRIVPVVDCGRLVGLVTPENVSEFLAIRAAVAKLTPSPPLPA